MGEIILKELEYDRIKKEELLNELERRVWKYQNKYGLKPNLIKISRNLIDTFVDMVYYLGNGTYSFMGIDVEVVYDKFNYISVGYME